MPDGGSIETLGAHIYSLVRSRHGDALWAVESGEQASSELKLEEIADVVYTFALTGRWDLLKDAGALGLAQRLKRSAMAGAISGSPAAPIETLNVHATAYGLGALALFVRAGHNRFAECIAPASWKPEALCDEKTGVPKFPAKFTHHNWRVSHWLGGVPAIYAILETHAGVNPAPSARETLAAIERVLDKSNGLIKAYNNPAMQWAFRKAYKMRHDPELGDYGGVAHILWVQYFCETRIIAPEALYENCRRLLLELSPFMESTPYCLDFDIIQIARVAGQSIGRLEADTLLQERAVKLYRDTRNFLQDAPPEDYNLHRYPGALATMHECALVAPELHADVEADFGLRAPVDIIKQAGWL